MYNDYRNKGVVAGVLTVEFIGYDHVLDETLHQMCVGLSGLDGCAMHHDTAYALSSSPWSHPLSFFFFWPCTVGCSIYQMTLRHARASLT